MNILKTDAPKLTLHKETILSISTGLRAGYWAAAKDTKAGTMRFPNARYVISDREWDYWSDPDSQGSVPDRWRGMIPGTQAAFKLIADRTTRIKPGTEIVSGIGTVESHGHTPGHMSIQLASAGEQALVVGDY